jgi:L-asparaginase
MKNSKGVHFIITGGTIDSYYDQTKDTVVPSKDSIIPQFITSLQLSTKIKFSQVCMKDSRAIQEKDRRKILQTIQKSPYETIIITHGTYTMPDTGRFLKVNLKANKKVIILTGAMIPMPGFTLSDGPFNLGFALAKADELSAGVYVAMNGKVFAPEEVVKNTSSGKFSSIFGER